MQKSKRQTIKEHILGAASLLMPMANTTQGEPHLLQATNIQCEHGHSDLCGKLPEHLYLTFPLALNDFQSQNW